MKKKYFLGIILCCIFLSCNDHEKNKVQGVENNYSLIIFNSDGIGFSNHMKTFGEIDDSEFKVYNNNHQIVQSGLLSNGMKTGHWDYYFSGNQKENISWQKFNSVIHQISLSYPSNWKISDTASKSIFFATVDTTTNDNKEYFVVLRHSAEALKKIENAGSLLESYSRYFDKYQNSKEKINHSDSYDIVLNSGTKFKFLLYEFNRQGKEFLSISIIREYQGDIIDCTMLTEVSNSRRAYVEFFGVIQDLFFEGKRFMSPYDNFNTVNGQKINW